MALEKLSIMPEIGPSIQALFNPEKYTASRSVQFAEIAIPGLDAPVIQFVRGQAEKVALELFFDTTDQGTVDPVVDVRTLTSLVYNLLDVQSNTHAPPRLILTWGEGGQLFNNGKTISPWCVLESVSQEFTLFSPGGVPLRAKLNVAFHAAWTIGEQLTQTPRHSSDRTRFVRVRRQQTISEIAWQQYNDPDGWRPIAEANDLDNPRFLEPGSMLTIPSLDTAKG
jgi:nucleoid-associated protein YgaU